jgi:hypothetical protein
MAKAEAWNTHDMSARALLVTQDADSIHITRPTRAGVPARPGRSYPTSRSPFQQGAWAGSRDIGCVQRGRSPHTDRFALVLGPGGCGGELGWRFGVYPA